MRAGNAILLPDIQPVRSFGEYREKGGGEAFQKALKAKPENIIDLVRRAGLRGRGGAGFPTATKWEGIANSADSTRFICCNGAEGEPGTFKDRYLLRKNPYQVIEGLAIGAQVTGAQRAYICLKRDFAPEIEAVERALDELRAESTMAKNMELVLGPDEYLVRRGEGAAGGGGGWLAPAAGVAALHAWAVRRGVRGPERQSNGGQ